MPPLPKITTKAAGAADLLSCSTKLRRSPRAAESQLHWLIVAFPLLSNATTQHPDNALQVDCCFHVFLEVTYFLGQRVVQITASSAIATAEVKLLPPTG